jgi:hypothetical protein
MEDKISQQRLRFFFGRNGYLRFPDAKRQQQEGHSKYKKGSEVRLVAYDETELTEIRNLLQQMGFKLANSHAKAKQHIQPIYGKQAVERFCEMVGKQLETEE